MPLYEYKCKNCGNRRDFFLKLSELSEPQFCFYCEGEMTRQLSPPRLNLDYPGYSCPITGKWVEGRREHRENLEKHGCRVLEAGEVAEFDRDRKREEAELGRKIEDSVGSAIANWGAEKQQKLQSELERGASLSLDRK